MTGHEAREWLSAYLDGVLEPADRRRVEAHLDTCAECRDELTGLRQTVALLGRVTPARAPAGFVDRVATAARPRPWYRRVAAAVFQPLSIKLPAEVTALVMVALLAGYLFERTPELQQAARPEESGFEADRREAERAGSEPPARQRLDPTARVADEAPRAAPPARSKAEAPAPGRAPSERDLGGGRSRDIAPPPPRSPAAPAPPPAAAPEARPEATRKATRDAPSGAAVGEAGRPGAENRPGAQERTAKSSRTAPPTARPSATGPRPFADVVTRVAVKDRDAAERELTALIARLGGSVSERRREDEVTVVEAVVPQPRYAEFSEGLARIGTWQVEAERPDLPARLRVILRLQ